MSPLPRNCELICKQHAHHLPSGLNFKVFTCFVCPLYVWRYDFLRKSHTCGIGEVAQES